MNHKYVTAVGILLLRLLMKNINCKVKCWIKFLFKSVKQKIFQRRILSPTANTQCLNSPLSRLPNTLLTPPPLMRRLPTWSQSLIPLRSPLSLLQGGRGRLKGVIGRACSGESRPLVWGHKTVSLCVSAVLQGQKDIPIFGHTNTHTCTEPSSLILQPPTITAATWER